MGFCSAIRSRTRDRCAMVMTSPCWEIELQSSSLRYSYKKLAILGFEPGDDHQATFLIRVVTAVATERPYNTVYEFDARRAQLLMPSACAGVMKCVCLAMGRWLVGWPMLVVTLAHGRIWPMSPPGG